MHRVEQLFTWIVNLFAVVAAILLMAIMFATVFKVGLRGVFGIGIIGTDQLSGTAMVYMTFLGAVWVLRHNRHVTVDLLLIGASVPLRRILIVVNSLIGAAVCFAVSYYGFHAVSLSIQRGIMVAAELELPRWIGLLPIPVGTFLLGVEFLRRALVARRGGFDGDASARVEA